jgi:hypothetical protein
MKWKEILEDIPTLDSHLHCEVNGCQVSFEILSFHSANCAQLVYFCPVFG